ncbi:MAG: 16S rRNA methyltransferase [Verrucomicrobia bacterium RIFCSPLOWO2_12_FULL_64_8]|nr:MAG: 16S rRNA methyltransferase [Verrucomicrobia bacterium RIFCSPLOWO2_12_FULL_64_8]
MPDFRVYCQPPEREPSVIRLTADESHHLVAVNRARPGDTVVAFDGRGSEWICELLEGDRREASLKVRFVQKARPLPCEITLGQALPKGPFMDAIVRKATELGAACIVPLESDRVVVQLDDDRSERKVEKWRLAATEAAKQCGNPFIPEILPVQKATAFMEASRGHELKLIASLQPAALPLKSVLAAFAAAHGRPPRKVLWLVGPEGDFTPAELGVAKSFGFEPITLGPLVLRCETAAIYALSVISYELQGG